MEVTLTDSAKDKISRVMNKASKGEDFRVGLKVGGCNGFSYTFEIDSFDDDEDEVLLDGGQYRIIVNHKALAFLLGSTIDYVEGIAKSEFVVTNPNFTACGCGKSIG